MDGQDLGRLGRVCKEILPHEAILYIFIQNFVSEKYSIELNVIVSNAKR